MALVSATINAKTDKILEQEFRFVSDPSLVFSFASSSAPKDGNKKKKGKGKGVGGDASSLKDERRERNQVFSDMQRNIRTRMELNPDADLWKNWPIETFHTLQKKIMAQKDSNAAELLLLKEVHKRLEVERTETVASPNLIVQTIHMIDRLERQIKTQTLLQPLIQLRAQEYKKRLLYLIENENTHLKEAKVSKDRLKEQVKKEDYEFLDHLKVLPKEEAGHWRWLFFQMMNPDPQFFQRRRKQIENSPEFVKASREYNEKVYDATTSKIVNDTRELVERFYPSSAAEKKKILGDFLKTIHAARKKGDVELERGGGGGKEAKKEAPVEEAAAIQNFYQMLENVDHEVLYNAVEKANLLNTITLPVKSTPELQKRLRLRERHDATYAMFLLAKKHVMQEFNRAVVAGQRNVDKEEEGEEAGGEEQGDAIAVPGWSWRLFGFLTEVNTLRKESKKDKLRQFFIATLVKLRKQFEEMHATRLGDITMNPRIKTFWTFRQKQENPSNRKDFEDAANKYLLLLRQKADEREVNKFLAPQIEKTRLMWIRFNQEESAQKEKQTQEEQELAQQRKLDIRAQKREERNKKRREDNKRIDQYESQKSPWREEWKTKEAFMGVKIVNNLRKLIARLPNDIWNAAWERMAFDPRFMWPRIDSIGWQTTTRNREVLKTFMIDNDISEADAREVLTHLRTTFASDFDALAPEYVEKTKPLLQLATKVWSAQKTPEAKIKITQEQPGMISQYTIANRRQVWAEMKPRWKRWVLSLEAYLSSITSLSKSFRERVTNPAITPEAVCMFIHGLFELSEMQNRRTLPVAAAASSSSSSSSSTLSWWALLPENVKKLLFEKYTNPDKKHTFVTLAKRSCSNVAKVAFKVGSYINQWDELVTTAKDLAPLTKAMHNAALVDAQMAGKASTSAKDYLIELYDILMSKVEQETPIISSSGDENGGGGVGVVVEEGGEKEKRKEKIKLIKRPEKREGKAEEEEEEEGEEGEEEEEYDDAIDYRLPTIQLRQGKMTKEKEKNTEKEEEEEEPLAKKLDASELTNERGVGLIYPRSKKVFAAALKEANDEEAKNTSSLNGGPLPPPQLTFCLKYDKREDDVKNQEKKELEAIVIAIKEKKQQEAKKHQAQKKAEKVEEKKKAEKEKEKKYPSIEFERLREKTRKWQEWKGSEKEKSEEIRDFQTYMGQVAEFIMKLKQHGNRPEMEKPEPPPKAPLKPKEPKKPETSEVKGVGKEKEAAVQKKLEQQYEKDLAKYKKANKAYKQEMLTYKPIKEKYDEELRKYNQEVGKWEKKYGIKKPSEPVVHSRAEMAEYIEKLKEYEERRNVGSTIPFPQPPLKYSKEALGMLETIFSGSEVDPPLPAKEIETRILKSLPWWKDRTEFRNKLEKLQSCFEETSKNKLPDWNIFFLPEMVFLGPVDYRSVARVFYHKGAKFNIVSKLVNQRVPTPPDPITAITSYSPERLKKEFGWDESYYTQYFRETKTLAPNFALYLQTPFLNEERKTFQILHVLNAIPLTFLNAEEPDEMYFRTFGFEEATEWEFLKNFYQKLFQLIFNSTNYLKKSHKINRIVLQPIGYDTFLDQSNSATPAGIQSLKNFLIKAWKPALLGVLPSFKKNEIDVVFMNVSDWFKNDEDLAKLETWDGEWPKDILARAKSFPRTLFLNIWNPHSLPGNTNTKHTFGHNSALSALGSGMTNKYLSQDKTKFVSL